MYPKQAWYENCICIVLIFFALFLQNEYSKKNVIVDYVIKCLKL